MGNGLQMDKLTNRLKMRSLRSSFIYMVFVMTALVSFLSVLTIVGCFTVREMLVPINDEVQLTVITETPDGNITEEDINLRTNGEPNVQLVAEDWDQIVSYCINPISSPVQLSPKRQLLYESLPIIMVAFPLMYAVIGIVLSSLLYYHKKLKKPLAILIDSSEKISTNDLDFTVSYNSSDELGMLCVSFEKMRAALVESNQIIWNMMEERRQLNASVAHDLRTPITIIEGYTEYLQQNIPVGKINEVKLMNTLSNLSETAKRLEQYVESVRDVQSLDEIELKQEYVHLRPTVDDMVDDLKFTTLNSSKELHTSVCLPDIFAWMDRQSIYRILENVISNSIRYAEHIVKISFAWDDGILTIVVSDDGKGFSSKDLKSACTPFYKEADMDGHMGLGLTISSILCKKHGGEILLSNGVEGGAVIHITLFVKS
jgi:two-component system, OmpR family, lantibiotic biosynthesis sensor histidine kinase NisK/SpaK